MTTNFPELPALPAFADLPSHICASHAMRAAEGLCRECLRPFCGECLTKADGVNRCASCIARHDGESMRARGVRAARAPVRTVSVVRLFGLVAFYSTAAVAAATWGVGMPFFANERKLEANKDRVTEVQLALSAYYDDVGRYPSPERGLGALLFATDDDRSDWHGPYTTSRAIAGKGPAAAAAAIAPIAPAEKKESAAKNGKDAAAQVLDVFGQPVFYYAARAAASDDEEPGPDTVYIASAGANGTWDTPGVEGGNPPHDPGGDDVVKWIAWP